VLFEQATGTQIKQNQSEYFGAAEDTIYLSGMAAGAATKKGVIGYVVPFGSRGRPAHQRLHPRCAGTHPGAKVKIVWTNAWYDPAEGDRSGQGARLRGADVLGQNVDSPGCRRLRREGRDPVGRLRLRREEVRAEAVADRLGLQLGPVLRAPDPGGDQRHLEAGFYYGSVKDGFTALAPYGPKVSAKTKAAIAAKRQQVVSGKWHSFCGPIYDQSGAVKIPKGTCLDPKDQGGDRRALLHAVVGQGRARVRLPRPASGLGRWGIVPPVPLRQGGAPVTRRPSGRLDARHHEALPRRARERQGLVRGGRR
jgi:basic membrane protein A